MTVAQVLDIIAALVFAVAAFAPTSSSVNVIRVNLVAGGLLLVVVAGLLPAGLRLTG